MSAAQNVTDPAPWPAPPEALATETPHKPLPPEALAISAFALAVPSLSSFLAPEWMTAVSGMLVWLTALVPAFLFAYYRGWKGVLIALGLALAVLTSVHGALFLLGLSEPDWSLLLGVGIAYVGVCLCLGILADRLHRARYEAEQRALTDTLTTLPNRRHAILILERAFAAAARGVPVCVALFDLDNFKDFNDRHGHVAGDHVLMFFGQVLRGYTRAMDLSARFGGEEFLSVLLDGDEEGARVFAERVRERLKTAELAYGPVTVSCGVAVYNEEMRTIEDLVAAADQALYTAKKGGRDQVVLADPRLVSDPA